MQRKSQWEEALVLQIVRYLKGIIFYNHFRMDELNFLWEDLMSLTNLFIIFTEDKFIINQRGVFIQDNLITQNRTVQVQYHQYLQVHRQLILIHRIIL